MEKFMKIFFKGSVPERKKVFFYFDDFLQRGFFLVGRLEKFWRELVFGRRPEELVLAHADARLSRPPENERNAN